MARITTPTTSAGKGRPRRRFAQHFLEPTWARKVIQAIAPSPGDLFLEIGPGRGALTRPLAATGARIVAVEIDRDLAARLAAELPPTVTVITGDFLATDIVAALADARAHLAGRPDAEDRVPRGAPVRVVGNLPYRISTPILFRLLDLQRRHGLFHDATLMLQKEVADRLMAPPGSRAYGVLSVFVQLDADVSPLLLLPPGAFRPAPRVRSTLVRLAFRPRRIPVADVEVFSRLVRALFTKRRKTVLNAFRPLAALFGIPAEKALERSGIDPRRRPETLTLEELARLSERCASSGRPPVL